MAYKSIYRRYRPIDFEEVIGQKYIIQTIKNSILNDKIGHAYLFSGPRGIGKTTIARIVAKAVNCLNPNEGNPCNACDVCKAVNEGSAIDVIEIDAASNNGVDEMRNLLEKVNFLPSSFKKKIYIIDEVHMLSMSAFNALLKTLEEPPVHVMFILATTEPHKVPATILSRCQRYDFKPLTIEEIKEQLNKVKDNEHINIDDAALEIVAEAAEGGMRDALSIMDQIFAYGKDEISAEDVNNITGRVSSDDIIELLKVVNECKVSDALDKANNILNTGKEVNTLINSMLTLCRDLVLYQNVKNTVNAKYIYTQDNFIELSKTIKKHKIFKFIDILNDTLNKIKHSNTPKIYLEVGIVKMISNDSQVTQTSIAESVDLTDVYDRMQNLESLFNQIKQQKNNDDINEFKDFTKSKLEFLEEVVSRCAVPPKDLEERIEFLEEQATNEELDRRLKVVENKLNDSCNIESANQENVSSLDFADRINSLEDAITNIVNNVSNNVENKEDPELINKIQDIALQLEAYENIFVKQSDLNEQLEKFKSPQNNFEDLYDRIAKIEESLNNTPIDSTHEEPSAKFEHEHSERFDQIENEDFFNTYDDSYVDASEFEKMNDNYLTLLNKVVELQNSIKDEKEEIEKYIVLFNELHEYVSNIPTNNIDEETIKKLEDQINDVKEYSIKVGSRCTALEEKIKGFKQEAETKQTIQRRPQPFETPLREEQQVREQTIVPTEVVEKVVEETVEQLPEGQIDETAKVYDIRVIENILHQSRDRKNIEDKDKINSVWYRLSSLVPQNLASVAATLSEGKVVVNGANYFIIVYQKASVCNYLMNAQNHYEAKEVLRLTLQKEYDFIALPINTWHEKSTEYKGQYHMGIRYPKLTPINNPELKVINVTKNPFQTQGSQNYDKATQIFGKTLIREVK